jgi:CRISPR-associated protein Cmr3
MRLLEFEPVNPPSLHGASIGGIEVFGMPKALPTPLPTTVAGALGNYLGVRLSGGDPLGLLSELYNTLGELLGCRGSSCIKGPLTYFEVGGRRLPEPYVNVERHFIPLAGSIKVSGDGVVCIERDVRPVVWEPIARVGVALERRGEGEKRVMPGYFFKYAVSTYRLDSKTARPVFTYVTPLEKDIRGLLRFGGEGSIARVVSKRPDHQEDLVTRVVTPLEGLDEGYYVALSPVPLLPKKQYPTELEKDLELPLGIRDSRVLGIPSRCGEEARPPKLRVVRLGLGFSEVSRTRRPQVLALPPGTIIEVSRRHKPHISPLMNVLLGLGFATLFKLT